MEAVTAEKARQLELTFLGRFDQCFGRRQGFSSPVDGRWVSLAECNVFHSEDPSLLPSSVAGAVVRYGERRKILPRNSASFYLVSVKPESASPFAVGALCYSHITAYAEQGVDMVPASLGELTGILERAVELGRGRDTVYLLGIASPVGWAPAAEEAIAGSPSTRGFSSPHLAVCLVDLSSNALTFNPGDLRITNFLGLFSGELEEEAIRRVAHYIRQALLTRQSQSVAEVAEATKAASQVVHRVFALLEAEGPYVVERLKGLGQVISRRL